MQTLLGDHLVITGGLFDRDGGADEGADEDGEDCEYRAEDWRRRREVKRDELAEPDQGHPSKPLGVPILNKSRYHLFSPSCSVKMPRAPHLLGTWIDAHPPDRQRLLRVPTHVPRLPSRPLLLTSRKITAICWKILRKIPAARPLACPRGCPRRCVASDHRLCRRITSLRRHSSLPATCPGPADKPEPRGLLSRVSQQRFRGRPPPLIHISTPHLSTHPRLVSLSTCSGLLSRAHAVIHAVALHTASTATLISIAHRTAGPP